MSDDLPRDDPEAEYARVLAENDRHADAFDRSALPAAPATGLAILTCMDARIDPADAFGLRPGDAHVLRNAGAVVTDDVLRSLVLSQHLLGTDQVLVVAHTGCGVQGVDDIGLTSQLVAGTGRRVGIDFAGFDDLEAHVREQVERIRAHPWVREVAVRGLVYDVRSGRLRPIV